MRDEEKSLLLQVVGDKRAIRTVRDVRSRCGVVPRGLKALVVSLKLLRRCAVILQYPYRSATKAIKKKNKSAEKYEYLPPRLGSARGGQRTPVPPSSFGREKLGRIK